MKTLRDVPVGATSKVVRIHGEGALKRRIMDMGILSLIHILTALTTKRSRATTTLRPCMKTNAR